MCYNKEKYKHASAEWTAQFDIWMVFKAQSMQQLKNTQKLWNNKEWEEQIESKVQSVIAAAAITQWASSFIYNPLLKN